MSLGFDPDTFWRATPKILDRLFRGAQEREFRRQELTAWAAWHSAAFGRQKKMPSYKSILPQRPKRPQTISEMKTAALAWDARINAKRGH